MKKLFKKFYKLFILLFIIIMLFISPLRNYLNINYLKSIIEELRNNTYAPFIFIGIYILGVILALPGFALTILAAPIFGFWKGLLLVIISANIGCQITYFISKFFGNSIVQKFIKDDSFIGKLSKKIESDGFIIMLYLRLIPFVPFNVVNYVSGLTKISYKNYSIATFFGMLPGIAIYVYLSYTVSDIKNNPFGLIISIAILIMFTIGISIFKRKQGILNEKEGERDEI